MKKPIKGNQIEAGIWRHASGKGYVAEINYNNQTSGRRIREQKTLNRLDLAREWRQTRKADALRGAIRQKKDEPKPISFATFAIEYLEQWSKVTKKESTYIRDQVSIKQLQRVFGKRMLTEITRRDIERYISKRKEDGVTPATCNRELSCIKNMLRKALDWEYIKVNPAWGIKQERETPPEFGFLTEAEIHHFLSVATPHLQVFFTLAIYTGMRRGELFKLEWRDVDYNQGEQGMITVRTAKNHDTRYIPMSRIVRQAIERHPKRIVEGKICPMVFSSAAGHPITDVKKGFAGTLKRTGIERHIRFHDLRHTFASHLVMKGIDLRTAAKLLGHRDIKMTMRYAHLAPDHLQAAVDVLETSQISPNREVANSGSHV